MTCRYCRRPIYFTGVIYRLVSTKSNYCWASPDTMHHRY